MKAWKQALREDDTANIVAAPVAGTKRKAVSILAPGPAVLQNLTATPDAPSPIAVYAWYRT